jgi:phosphoribosylpyrophosphate synthetase
MIFADRNEAGKLLAERLKKELIKNPIVVAIPGGGIPVAYPITQTLKSELRLSITRKKGQSFYDELNTGTTSLYKLLLSPGQIPEKIYIEETIEKERRRIRETIRIVDHEITKDLIEGKTVLLVDDGIATGNTMQLALEEIKSMNPKKIFICTPVCTIKAKEKLQTQVDEMILLLTPVSFAGIGAYYHNFNQLTDNEIVELLRKNISVQKNHEVLNPIKYK